MNKTTEHKQGQQHAIPGHPSEAYTEAQHLAQIAKEDPVSLIAQPYWARPESVHPDPADHLPEHSMPAEIAKNLVHDVLEFNMNPRLNMCGWLTTHMETQATEIITESLYVNAIDSVEYPASSMMAKRCVTMMANLWHAPPGFTGTETVGSTEAVYLGVLAMKKNWQKRRQEQGLPASKPNIVYGANAQVAWHKACVYFDIESRQVKLHDGQLVIDPEKVPALIDENTIGVGAMVGSTYTGQYEDVERLNEVLEEIHHSRGYFVPLHVDAAAGGLVAPLCQPHFIFDFRLNSVQSISFSGHKYGIVYPGIALVVFRSEDWVHESLKFTVDYLGKAETHFTLNFSRPGCYVAALYYNFVRFGKEGYRRIFSNLFLVYDFLSKELDKTGHFEILSTSDLPVVAFRLKTELEKGYDEYDIMHQLKEFRLMVPAYTMAPDAQHIKLLRACLRPGFDMEMACFLVDSLNKCISYLDENGGRKQEREQGKADGGGGDGHVIC